MSYMHAPYGGYLVRPALPNHQAATHYPMNYQTVVRLPIHQQPPVVNNTVPRFLPVLHPPTFPKQSDFEEEEEIFNYTTVVFMDQHRTITQQSTTRIPTYIPQQLPPSQQFVPRHVKPKNSSYIYYNR